MQMGWPLEEGGNGYLFNAGNVDQLADKLNKISSKGLSDSFSSSFKTLARKIKH